MNLLFMLIAWSGTTWIYGKPLLIHAKKKAATQWIHTGLRKRRLIFIWLDELMQKISQCVRINNTLYLREASGKVFYKEITSSNCSRFWLAMIFWSWVSSLLIHAKISPFQRKYSRDSKHPQPCRRFCCLVKSPALDTIKWWPREYKPSWVFRKPLQGRNLPIWCILCCQSANFEAWGRDGGRGDRGNRRCHPAIAAGNSVREKLKICLGSHGKYSSAAAGGLHCKLFLFCLSCALWI